MAYDANDILRELSAMHDAAAITDMGRLVHENWAVISNALKTTVAVRQVVEICAQIAEDEPEFPGEPEPAVLAALRSVDPIDNARAACRATKLAIARNIRRQGE